MILLKLGSRGDVYARRQELIANCSYFCSRETQLKHTPKGVSRCGKRKRRQQTIVTTTFRKMRSSCILLFVAVAFAALWHGSSGYRLGQSEDYPPWLRRSYHGQRARGMYEMYPFDFRAYYWLSKWKDNNAVCIVLVVNFLCSIVSSFGTGPAE